MKSTTIYHVCWGQECNLGADSPVPLPSYVPVSWMIKCRNSLLSYFQLCTKTGQNNRPKITSFVAFSENSQRTIRNSESCFDPWLRSSLPILLLWFVLNDSGTFDIFLTFAALRSAPWRDDKQHALSVVPETSQLEYQRKSAKPLRTTVSSHN